MTCAGQGITTNRAQQRTAIELLHLDRIQQLEEVVTTLRKEVEQKEKEHEKALRNLAKNQEREMVEFHQVAKKDNRELHKQNKLLEKTLVEQWNKLNSLEQ